MIHHPPITYALRAVIDEYYHPPHTIETDVLNELYRNWRGPTLKQIQHRHKQILPKKRMKWYRHIVREASVIEGVFRLLGMENHGDCMKQVALRAVIEHQRHLSKRVGV